MSKALENERAHCVKQVHQSSSSTHTVLTTRPTGVLLALSSGPAMSVAAWKGVTPLSDNPETWRWRLVCLLRWWFKPGNNHSARHTLQHVRAAQTLLPKPRQHNRSGLTPCLPSLFSCRSCATSAAFCCHQRQPSPAIISHHHPHLKQLVTLLNACPVCF